MVQIIRVLFTYPALYLIQKIIQRLSFFTGMVILAIILFFTKEYISTNLSIDFFSNLTNTSSNDSQENVIREVTIQKGDTLSAVLHKQGIPNADVKELITLAQIEKTTSRLKIGQKFIFSYDLELIETPGNDLNEERLSLNRMAFQVDKINSIEFIRQENKFIAHHISAPLQKLVTQYETTIDSSVISSLKKSGMSTNAIVKLINAYSHQIDFQRQIKSGDKITVLTEKFVTDKNEFSHHGEILYASLKTGGENYNIYRYSPDNKAYSTQFFSENGTSIKGNLLRTPVKVARVSSHFGYRTKHPVHGYGAMHKGVDFAAAIGTPIYAAGSGKVDFIGWKSGYGRFIVLKHDGNLSTAYAHASKFASNLKRGSRVKQGDIIAFVGKSGRVTGPHLHYEVRVNGQQVNPMKFKSTPGIKLTGSKLANFNKHKEQIKALGNKLGSDIEVVAKDITGVKLF
ncbi:MAG: peptidoglycan DD-metalloendopeptidase family protein [Rickettsiaceae bacterium]|nr:peptidoglycan DD-metalloendopeptidase family protein [Rickettsiaceae bacterium]